jgi:hypothetical protein
MLTTDQKIQEILEQLYRAIHKDAAFPHSLVYSAEHRDIDIRYCGTEEEYRITITRVN